MALCKSCTSLLQKASYWKPERIKWDIDALVQSCQRCPLCRYLCDFFKIPIYDIRVGDQWPYPEQIIKSWREIENPNHPWCTRKKLEYTLEFRIWAYEYQRIEGSLIPKNFYLKGTNEYYPEPVERPLPLGTGDYRDSQGVLGVQVQNGGMFLEVF